MATEAISVDVKSLFNQQECIDDSHQVQFSAFDSCVDNHFNALERIYRLCGEPEDDSIDTECFEKFSSSVTFIREWRSFNYRPREIRFACLNGSENILNLTQFSSATIPTGRLPDITPSSVSSKDFVMYVGGPIWALDWCPRSHKSRHDITCEFIAVSCHPPESSYHNVGVPLAGRGLIQIWCLMNVMMEEKSLRLPVKRKGRPRKDENLKTESNMKVKPKRPRGRPRKTPTNGNSLESEGKYLESLSAEFAEGSASLIAFDGVISSNLVVRRNIQGKKKLINQPICTEYSSTYPIQLPNEGDFGHVGEFVDVLPTKFSEMNTNDLMKYKQQRFDATMYESGQFHSKSIILGNATRKNSVPEDLVSPRIMLCLAHNGKVAWDIKWKPHDQFDSNVKPRMGFLAVLLGNGSLEVYAFLLRFLEMNGCWKTQRYF